jgi:hypothetical protein
MKRLLGTFLLLAAVAVDAAGAKPAPRLHAYLTKVSVEVRHYQVLEVQLGEVLAEPPMTNVDPVVDELNALANEFGRMGRRWYRIVPRHGLIVRHRRMGRAFELQQDAWSTYAAALYTRHVDEIDAASEHMQGLLRSAAYLQKRWAAALQGALIGAEITVPHWLHAMAAGP